MPETHSLHRAAPLHPRCAAAQAPVPIAPEEARLPLGAASLVWLRYGRAFEPTHPQARRITHQAQLSPANQAVAALLSLATAAFALDCSTIGSEYGPEGRAPSPDNTPAYFPEPPLPPLICRQDAILRHLHTLPSKFGLLAQCEHIRRRERRRRLKSKLKLPFFEIN